MSATTEIDLLERMVPELEAEGYDVYLHPNRPLLPGFLGDFRPDAVALRKDKNLVIEVVGQSPGASDKLAKLTKLLQGQKDWELRVVWVSRTRAQEPLQVQPLDMMQARIREMKELAADGHIEPAMLLGWATFEALARAASTGQFSRPQTPGRLVQILATEGYLTPTEADGLRALADKRNKLAHGELNIRVSDTELQQFASVLETMLEQVPR
jgi:hypothetical protein